MAEGVAAAAAATTMTELRFICMGTECRVLVEHPDPLLSRALAATAKRSVIDAAKELTVFGEGGALNALNRDPRDEVPAPAVLRRAVQAALDARTETGGLVDVTAVGDPTAKGERCDLAAALRDAPPRRAARPAVLVPIEVTDTAVRRPPGTTIDLGGVAKGLIADLAAEHLTRAARAVVDCGGDLRVLGTVDVHVDGAGVLRVTDAGVATSGIDRSVWRAADGSPRHHLVDPSTGEPAWTGVVRATATAPTAARAEARAKAAFLANDDRYGLVQREAAA